MIKLRLKANAMRMFKTHKLLGMLMIGLILAPMLVQAKELPKNLEPLEEIPPPKISGDADPDEPEVTIIKKETETVEEYRINGQLYMIKVTPANGVPYYLHKEDQNGEWINSGPIEPMSIPKWTIFRF